MGWSSFLLDLIPMILSVYAIVRLQACRQNRETTTAMISAILLLICQSSWIHSYLNGLALSLIDSMWAVFNAVCMLMAINVANANRK